jgi:TetR/AcrR family transcriptional repressor of nem operon
MREPTNAAYSLASDPPLGQPRSDDLREHRRQEREEAKQRTRHALMAAGLDAFIESGLDVSLAEICGRAGYSRGAFYVHFHDRQDFVIAITEWIVTAMMDTFIADEASPNGLAVTAQRFTHALDTEQWPLMSRIPVATVRLMDALIRWPELRRAFGRFTIESIEKMRKGVEAGQDAGSVRADLDPQAVGAMFVMASMGAVLFRNVGLSMDYQRQAETLLRLISPASAAAVDAKEKSSRAS